jgi:hypothetical protein
MMMFDSLDRVLVSGTWSSGDVFNRLMMMDVFNRLMMMTLGMNVIIIFLVTRDICEYVISACAQTVAVQLPTS